MFKKKYCINIHLPFLLRAYYVHTQKHVFIKDSLKDNQMKKFNRVI